jgi:hypothetical protein
MEHGCEDCYQRLAKGNLKFMDNKARHLHRKASAEVGAAKFDDQGRSATTPFKAQSSCRLNLPRLIG